MKRTIIDASQLELEDNVVTIKRVTKVVKGGRNMKFTALVVVGDKNGHVGVGLGKATEIPEAIKESFKLLAFEASTLPDPVPPYTGLTEEIENKDTFEPAAKGKALLSFFNRAAPSASI